MDFEGRATHLIGIGGSGMLPLALLLCQAGARVTGVDRHLTDDKRQLLVDAGVRIGPPDTDQDWMCITSPAIPQHDPDLRLARRLGVPVMTRADALSALVRQRQNICIVGSHGKSTVTAILVHILEHSPDVSPGYMIGASQVDRAPAKLGEDTAPFVMESCEAFRALDHWTPKSAILTGIDDEHSEHYGGQDTLRDAFSSFLERVPADGAMIVNGDDAQAMRLAERTGKRLTTCGFGPSNTFRAVVTGQITTVFKANQPLGQVELRMPGRHNVMNALFALAMSEKLGVDTHQALKRLAQFSGLDRRLQKLSAPGHPTLIDDFAHHPREVAAGLEALRPTIQGRLTVIFEPQLHSRTSRLADQFAEALSLADHVVLLPTVGLGEAGHVGDGDEALEKALQQRGQLYEKTDTIDAVATRLAGTLSVADTLVVMGGQSAQGLAPRVAQILTAQEPSTGKNLSVLIGQQTGPAQDLLSQITAHVQKRPEAVAVEMGHRALSYAALWGRATALAAQMSNSGVAHGDVVSVMLRPSIDRVTSFLACLQIGAVYHPLDPDLPMARMQHMLGDCAAKAIVVNAASPALPANAPPYIPCDFIDRVHCAPRAETDAKPSDLAYLIYTSGSTGVPKGVEVSRGAISNYATAAQRHFDVSDSSRFSLVSAFGFDVNLGDMAVALTAGACLVIPTELESRPGRPMGQYLRDHRISHLSLTPSVLRAVPNANYPDLQTLISLGEACPPDLVETWAPGRRFINAYGPTEATVEVSFAECHAGEPVTIGTPFDNTGLCVLGPDLLPVGLGAEGELCIFGECLAQGYRNQPEQTMARFRALHAPSFLPDHETLRIYRTGDRARITPDDAVYFLGRLDDELKVLGHRVDPSDIERTIALQPDISECAVALAPAGTRQEKLTAFLVAAPGVGTIDTAQLRTKLAQDLPRYMRPALFVQIANIPRSPNGKQDKSALFKTLPAIEKTDRKAPQSETERRAMSVLYSLLPHFPEIGIRDHLFDAGMDSLDFVRFLTALEEEFACDLTQDIPPGAETLEIICLLIETQLGTSPRVPRNSGENQDLLDILTPHLATWPGQPLKDAGLFRCLSTDTAPQLFWMFQSGREFEALGNALASHGVTLAGTRSGHLLLSYSEENVIAMVKMLADEIEAIQSSDQIFVGANCQGGMIMLRVATELKARGLHVATVFLMEQGRFPRYDGHVHLMFGDGSYLNPYTSLQDPDAIFRAAYPSGYSVAFLPAQHGEYFRPSNVAVLADEIGKHMRDLDPNAKPQNRAGL